MVSLLFCAGNYLFAQQPEANFIKHTISTEFISEGVATGDVNQDGLTDILAGGYWFEAPDFNRHEIAQIGRAHV